MPRPKRLRQICKLLALLDTAYAETYPIFTYDVRPIGESSYMQSHSGDVLSIWFHAGGAVARGFELHSPMNREGQLPTATDLFKDLPTHLLPGGIGDYADGGEKLTFGIWIETEESAWRVGDATTSLDDGSENSLWMLADDWNTFLEFQNEIRPEVQDRTDVHALFHGAPISAAHPRHQRGRGCRHGARIGP